MNILEKHTPVDQPLLLAVDDQPENLRVLGSSLAKRNLNIAFATSGNEALEWLETNTPDIILLDVNMPGMDGFECCRQLKTRPELEHVPVIFLTARVESEDIQAGFSAGAVDYVTKPFLAAELLARVDTHLKIQEQRRIQEWQVKRLNELIGIIAHDIRGPVSSVRCLAQMLLEEFPNQIDEDIETSSHDLYRIISQSCERTISALNGLLNTKMTLNGEFSVRSEYITMANVFDIVRQRNYGQSLNKSILLNFQGSQKTVYADEKLLTEAIDNLVSNAIKYSDPDTTVQIEAITDCSDRVLIRVSDEGPGFAEEDYPRLFKKYERLSAGPTGGESSFGLGLSLVKDIIGALKGDVKLVSKPGESAVFELTLPANPQ